MYEKELNRPDVEVYVHALGEYYTHSVYSAYQGPEHLTAV